MPRSASWVLPLIYLKRDITGPSSQLEIFILFWTFYLVFLAWSRPSPAQATPSTHGWGWGYWSQLGPSSALPAKGHSWSSSYTYVNAFSSIRYSVTEKPPSPPYPMLNTQQHKTFLSPPSMETCLLASKHSPSLSTSCLTTFRVVSSWSPPSHLQY